MPSSRAASTASTSSGISSATRPKRRQPELRRDAVALARLVQQPREAAHERPGGLVPVLPVRIGRERREPGKRGDHVPVRDAVRSLGRGQQADRVPAAARGDVREHLAQEVDDRGLAERLHLGRELADRRRRRAPRTARSGTSTAPASSMPTCAGTIHAGSSQKTSSTPHSSTQSAHSFRTRGSASAVEARARDAASVVEHLALLRDRT